MFMLTEQYLQLIWELSCFPLISKLLLIDVVIYDYSFWGDGGSLDQ